MSAKRTARADRAKQREVKIIRVCGRPGQSDRPPLPAGHPFSWGLLTNGSFLEGSPYPFPVFLP